jgi:hypothetical protein
MGSGRTGRPFTRGADMSRSPWTETVTLKHARDIILCMAHRHSVLLLSGPGVGKSDVVYQCAAEAGLPCRSLVGTQIAPEDVSGVPRVVGERSVFCPPRVLLPERPEPFFLFLDELPACTPDVQKAFYALLLERRLGEHPLPEGTRVVAAGNRVEDRSLVRALGSAPGCTNREPSSGAGVPASLRSRRTVVLSAGMRLS